MIVLTFEDVLLEERLFELDDEALTMDSEEECLDEEFDVNDDMEKLPLDSVECFLLE